MGNAGASRVFGKRGRFAPPFEVAARAAGRPARQARPRPATASPPTGGSARLGQGDDLPSAASADEADGDGLVVRIEVLPTQRLVARALLVAGEGGGVAEGEVNLLGAGGGGRLQDGSL